MRELNKASTASKLAPSKNIPQAYLTTHSYDEITTFKSVQDDSFDHDTAGSSNNFVDIDNNLVDEDSTTNTVDSTTELGTTEPTLYGLLHLVNDTRNEWEQVDVALKTDEKVYVVTPVPKFQSSLKGIVKALKAETVVKTPNAKSLVDKFNEWPHLSKLFFTIFT